MKRVTQGKREKVKDTKRYSGIWGSIGGEGIAPGPHGAMLTWTEL